MEGAPNAKWTIVAWNDLGMHCVDGNDYSVFSILPPYNNIHAQVVDNNGKLVKSSTGLTITYQAVADSTGSINRTSASKTNFWQYVKPLFGVTLNPDVGLAGNAMPGTANVCWMVAARRSMSCGRAPGGSVGPAGGAAHPGDATATASAQAAVS